MNTQPTQHDIMDAWNSSVTASSAYDAARGRDVNYAELLDLRRERDEAYRRLCCLQDDARKAFAAKQAWRYSPKKKINYNYPVLDHVDSFVDANGKRVARVTHSYAPIEEIERFATANCLIAQRLPWSWWNPRPECTAVLLMSTDANEALR